MNFGAIITKRKIEKWSSWDLVYEWEDEIKKAFKIPFYYERGYFRGRYRVERLIARFPQLSFLLQTFRKAFVFEMSDYRNNNFNNARNIIPCIVDAYIGEKDIERFTRQYINNKVVFVMSRQVYDFLSRFQFPFLLYHLPISLPTKYRISGNEKFEKKYDLIVVGRPNPLLCSFLEEYYCNHPNIVYVYHKNIANQHVFYTSTGECIGEIDTRKKYFDLLKQCRIGLYSTSGMDDDKLTYEKNAIDTRGFHQVTPRFLEFMVAGCHIISRYECNSDTEFFELKKFGESVNNYSDFEIAVDQYLHKPVDMETYSHYLEKHYTSNILKILKDIEE